MPSLSRRQATTGALAGLTMLGLLPFSSAIGQQARLGMTVERVTVGLPAGSTVNLSKLSAKLRPLELNEISALAGLAKREVTEAHCIALADAVVDHALVARDEGRPLPESVTSQWKHFFRNGGTELTCGGTPRVIHVETQSEAAVVTAAISHASEKLGVNLWSHYGFAISFMRPVGFKTSEAGPSALSLK
jgi:hypothetical protein